MSGGTCSCRRVLQHSWVNLGRAFSEWAVAGEARRLLAYYHENSADEAASYPGISPSESTDTLWPRVSPSLADSRRLARTAPFLTWLNQWFNAPCLTWPAKAHQPVTIDGSAVADALLSRPDPRRRHAVRGSSQVACAFPARRPLLSLPGGTSHADSLSGYPCED